MGFNSGFKGLNDKVTSLFSYIDLHIQSIFHHQFFFRASRYIRVMKTNLLHYLSSVYFVSQPLHVSGISVAHRQGLYYIYIYIYTHTIIGTCCAFQLIVCWSTWSTDSQLKSTIRTNCCIYTVCLPIMGYKYARNM